MKTPTLGKEQATKSRWSINNLLKDKNLFQMVKKNWCKISASWTKLSLGCLIKDFDIEVKWFKSKLIYFLNTYAKIIYIIAYSKR